MPGPLRPGIFVWALLCSVLFVSTASFADCVPLGPLQAVKLAAVTDGDSLRLRDGRRVRLLGINAPELARDGRAAEPLANLARQTLQALLAGRQTVYLHTYGQDRYRRVLAEVYRQPGGEHLGEALLRRGLARAIVVPPQWRADDCLWAAEAAARAESLGLWAEPPRQSEAATADDEGFVVMTGRIESVSRSRHAIWLDLDGDVVLKVAEADWPHFSDARWQQWQGRNIELRGWLRSRSSKPPFASLKMDLRHPAMMRWLPRQSEGETK